ncbi:hypothetical protein [Actinoplanes subtropicus]|uniref:hypothetical protein n=1 Tax=Actinoplanes subtropicus TaxID=543632 RepID=UPI000B0063CA|nr:hypothetical protein [Actinoplanes subtropicus]
MKTTTTVLLAVAPLAAAAALIAAPAAPTLMCAAAAVPAYAETFKFTSSALAGMTAGRKDAPDQLAVAGPRGHSRAHPTTSVIVTVPSSCL